MACGYPAVLLGVTVRAARGRFDVLDGSKPPPLQYRSRACDVHKSVSLWYLGSVNPVQHTAPGLADSTGDHHRNYRCGAARGSGQAAFPLARFGHLPKRARDVRIVDLRRLVPRSPPMAVIQYLCRKFTRMGARSCPLSYVARRDRRRWTGFVDHDSDAQAV